MLRNRKVLIILSLLIAVGLWIYVMGEVNPTATITASNVKVQMVGNDSLEDIGLHATLEGPKTISVTIRGRRSEVYAARTKGITASIDVSTCDYGKNTKEISVKLPDGFSSVRIEDVSSTEAVFNVK